MKMKITKQTLLKISILLFITYSVCAQSYGTGALLDQEKFDLSPKAPPLSRGDFKKLPEFFSLKRFTPIPGDQGSSSTCTGWSTSYAARTILEAISNHWDTETINKKKFSPSYVYNQIRPKEGCNSGASIIDGMEILKNDGVLPFEEFGYDCEREVKAEDKRKASSFRLKEYREIASRKSKNKVLNIKKSLTQSKPVVIGFDCPKSFYAAKDVWHPKKAEYEERVNGHALTIIGFDDNVEGGAFEIMNSWGVNWGNEGFIWIRYSDINHFCVWAGELIAEKKNEIEKHIEVEVFLSEYQNKIIPLTKNISSYNSLDTFVTGTMFQIYLLNKEPSYLYIFGFDTHKGAEYIYPMNDLVSDYLAYDENNIVLPSEEHAFQLDNDAGLSSLIILLSTESIRSQIDHLIGQTKENLDFNNIITKLTSPERKVSYDSDLKANNKIYLKKSSSKDFISMIKIDIFHSDKEGK